jgi:hypothetical protein
VAASITINGVPGPLLTATAGQTITVNDVGGTATSWAWALASIPPGSTAVLLAPTAQTTTFVVDVEGTYLVQLIVDDTLPTESSATTIVAIPSKTSAQRVPAVGETVESGVRGWDTGAGSYLRLLDTRLENPGVVACVAENGVLAAGQFVSVAQDASDPFAKGAVPVLLSYPGERVLPIATAAAGTGWTVQNQSNVIGICLGNPSGTSPTPLGQVALVRVSGIYEGFTLGSWAATTDYPYLYLDGAGNVTDVLPAATGNVPPRIVAKVVRWHGSTLASPCDIYVYGTRQARTVQLEFGVGATWTATTPVYPGFNGSAVAAVSGVAPGRYPPRTILDQWELAGIRAWAQVAGTGDVTLQVVRADTLATIGGALTLTAGVRGISNDLSGLVPADVPLSVQLTLASGTSPGQLSVAIDLWEP